MYALVGQKQHAKRCRITERSLSNVRTRSPREQIDGSRTEHEPETGENGDSRDDRIERAIESRHLDDGHHVFVEHNRTCGIDAVRDGIDSSEQLDPVREYLEGRKALERNKSGNCRRFAPMMVDSWSRVSTASIFENAINQNEKRIPTAMIPTAPTTPVVISAPRSAESENDGYLEGDAEHLGESLPDKHGGSVHRRDEYLLEHAVLDVIDQPDSRGDR